MIFFKRFCGCVQFLMGDAGSGALEAWKETLDLIVLNRGLSRITQISRIEDSVTSGNPLREQFLTLLLS